MNRSGTLQQVNPSSEGLPPISGWRKTFAAFRNVNYRYFYAGQTVSLMGTWARTVALSWVSFDVTKSEFLLGIVVMLNSLPMLLFSIYAGYLADRFSKLRIFMATSWFALFSSLLLAFLFFRGPVHIVTLMVFSALWGLSSAFEMPARQSLMVELVGQKDLVNAIALNSAMVNSTRVVGSAFGGILYSTMGPAWCFLFDGLSYFAVLYGLYKIKAPADTIKTSTTEFKQILEGFKYLRENLMLARVVTLLLIMSLGAWAYLSQLAAFVPKQLKIDAEGFGWILAINSLGACTAALLVAYLGARLVREKTLYFGIGIYSFFIFLFGFQHHPLGAAFLLFFSGFGIILFFSTGNSLLQSHSPHHLRGRLMGIWALVFGGGMPIGSLWMGWVASKTGSGVALQIGGVFCVFGAFLVYRLVKKRN